MVTGRGSRGGCARYPIDGGEKPVVASNEIVHFPVVKPFVDATGVGRRRCQRSRGDDDQNTQRGDAEHRANPADPMMRSSDIGR